MKRIFLILICAFMCSGTVPPQWVVCVKVSPTLTVYNVEGKQVFISPNEAMAITFPTRQAAYDFKQTELSTTAEFFGTRPKYP